MSVILWVIGIVAIVLAGGWAIRFVGQAIDLPSKQANIYFRDMPYLASVGLALAVLAIAVVIYFYFIAPTPFFVWAVNGFIFFAICAFLFRLLGRNVGTEGTKKLFRQMPLTAAFGILVIIVYAFTSIFAGQISWEIIRIIISIGVICVSVAQIFYTKNAAIKAGVFFIFITLFFAIMSFIGPIAPYGQEEVFAKANLLPGGDPATGGDPAHLLGTDQIGRIKLLNNITNRS